jgi:hypothetical protein
MSHTHKKEMKAMTPDHTIEQRLRLRAAYLDSFGPTDDGALFMEAAEQIQTDQIMHKILANVLREVTGQQWPAVEAAIQRGIDEAFRGAL